MKFTFKNETDLYAKIEQIKTEINADKVNEDYRVSDASGWYTSQKDYRGNEIQHSFTRSLLITFLDCQENVSHNAMAIIRCNKNCYTYELTVNEIN
jgi:hypothetical protein